MIEKRGDTIRQEIKHWAGLAIGASFAGALSISTLVSLWGLRYYGRKKQRAEVPQSETFPIRIIDTKINTVPARLLGVSHAKEFTEQHYRTLEELIKGCCCSVLEATPGLTDNNVFYDARVYYGTMVELCKRYGRPVIAVNPFSDTGELSEELVGLFGVGFASLHSFKIVGKNSTRRDFLAHGTKTALGIYLFLSSPIISESPRWLLREIPLFEKNENRMDRYFVNHSFDQTNVEVANRLLYVSQRLTQEELRNGGYVLVSFGDRHTDGVDYYLRHPFVRWLKSAFYRCTYGLVDNDIVMKFVPGQNSWAQIKIPY